MAYDRSGKWIDPDLIDKENRRCPRITMCKGIQVAVGETHSTVGTGVLVNWKCLECGQTTAVPVPGTFDEPRHELENGVDDWRILRTGEDYLEVAPGEHDWRL